MASHSIEKALQQYDKFKIAAKRTKELAKIETERMIGGGASLVGGVLSGGIDAKYRDPDGTPKKVLGHVPALGAANLLIAGLGMSGYVPYYIGQLGLGGLSYNLGKWMFDKEVTRQSTQPAPQQQ